MIATELRIGNWMMGNKPFQIKANDIGIAYYHEKEKGEPRWQPIKLNADWCLRMGFNRTLSYDTIDCRVYEWELFLKGSDKEYHIVFHTDEDVFSDMALGVKCKQNDGCEYESSRNWIIREINYVHEIQNIYALINKQELIITK